MINAFSLNNKTNKNDMLYFVQGQLNPEIFLTINPFSEEFIARANYILPDGRTVYNFGTIDTDKKYFKFNIPSEAVNLEGIHFVEFIIFNSEQTKRYTVPQKCYYTVLRNEEYDQLPFVSQNATEVILELLDNILIEKTKAEELKESLLEEIKTEGNNQIGAVEELGIEQQKILKKEGEDQLDAVIEEGKKQVEELELHTQKIIEDVVGTSITTKKEPIPAARIPNNDIPSSKLKTSSDSDKIKMVNLADEVKLAIAGTAPVSPVISDGEISREKIADGAVTLDKVEFSKNNIENFDAGDNIFNVNNIEFHKKTLMNGTGVMVDDNIRCVSEYMLVKPSTEYTCVYALFYYDENKTFINDSITLGTKITPVNCAYIRIVQYELTFNPDSLSTTLVEKGKTGKPYPLIKKIFDISHIQNLGTENISEDLNFLKKNGKNLKDYYPIIDGYYNTSGAIVGIDTFKSIIINVAVGEKIYLNEEGSTWSVFYLDHGVFMRVNPYLDGFYAEFSGRLSIPFYKTTLESLIVSKSKIYSSDEENTLRNTKIVECNLGNIDPRHLKNIVDYDSYGNILFGMNSDNFEPGIYTTKNTLSYTSTHCRSPKIPVKPGDTISASPYMNKKQTWVHAVYDKDGEYIETIDFGNICKDGSIIEIPESRDDIAFVEISLSYKLMEEHGVGAFYYTWGNLDEPLNSSDTTKTLSKSVSVVNDSLVDLIETVVYLEEIPLNLPLETGLHLGANGAINHTDSHCRTEKIPVKPGEVYWIGIDEYVNTNNHAYFNSDGVWLGYFNSKNLGKILIPNIPGIAYVEFSFKKENSATAKLKKESKKWKVKDDILVPYELKKEDLVDCGLLTKTGINLIKESDLPLKLGIYTTGSDTLSHTSTHCRSPKIPVKPGEVYWVSEEDRDTGTALHVYYSEGGVWLGSFNCNNMGKVVIPDLPGIAYVEFSIQVAFKDKPGVFKDYWNSSFQTIYRLDESIEIPNNGNSSNEGTADTGSRLYGKKMNVIGDSIFTYAYGGKPHHWWVASRNNMIVNNYGIGGSAIADPIKSPIVDRYITMSDDADIILVGGGINDYGSMITGGKTVEGFVGDINSTNKYTVYGALKILCEGLVTKYPGKIIAFLTPLPCASVGSIITNEDNKRKYWAIVQAIQDVCSVYSIPVLDFARCSGLHPELGNNNNIYFANNDKVHPNNDGHFLLSWKLESFLKSL